jgi:hypothetical protein
MKRTIRKFLNIVAAHIESLRHPPICFIEPLVSCQYIFKENFISIDNFTHSIETDKVAFKSTVNNITVPHAMVGLSPPTFGFYIKITSTRHPKLLHRYAL